MTLGTGIGDTSQLKAKQGTDCTNDYIVIEGKYRTANDLNRFAECDIILRVSFCACAYIHKVLIIFI